MKCVILAAGSMLHREAPLSGSWPKEPKPKALYHVRGEVLLERQIRLLRKVGIHDIIVVVGYRKELIEQFVSEKNLNVELVFCPESVNDVKWHRSGDYHHGMDSIRAGLKGIDDDVIFLMGDVYTSSDVLRQVVGHPDELSVWIDRRTNCHIFKVAKKYLPKLRAHNYPKGIPLHNFIFKEKNIFFREKFNPMENKPGTENYEAAFRRHAMSHKNWSREKCLFAAGTFDIDRYDQTDESKVSQVEVNSSQ